MRVALAADHAGFPLKAELLEFLEAQGYEVVDLGTDTPDIPSDYSDFAEAIGQAVLEGRAERGILICGSGVGASIAANKLRGVYSAVCHDVYSAHQGVEHDNMNILCLGSRVIGVMLARELALSFLHADFEADTPRHVRRHAKVQAIEQRNMK